LKITNNATGLLASNINSSVTTLSLASSAGSLFPSLEVGEWCPVVVVDGSGNREIMRCTGRSGDVLTVVRGQEGTSARSFNAGARVDARVTAAAYAEFALADEVSDALDLKADLDSPAFEGTPTSPTPAVSDNSEKIATTEFVVDYVPIKIGTILEYDGTELPPRFLWANGAAVSRSTYAAYFAIVGTRFGPGNGSTTFNVRDKRGRIGVGRDNMGGVSAAGRVTSAGSGIDGTTLGASGGSQTVTLDLTQIPAHVHDVSANQDAHGHSIPFSLHLSAATGGGTRGVNPDAPGATGSTDPAITISETSKGGGAAHNNMPPCDITNFIIYVGV
ncbi:MAG: tail fiber protein, partial [Actinomycetia bacterium]|nr:tail fiber protein [Actinomycetes bacterium]